MKLLKMCVLFLPITMFGQFETKLDSLADIVMKNQLDSNNIDFFITATQCSGLGKIASKDNSICLDDDIIYAFYKDKNGNYVQKVSNCGFYKPIKISQKAIRYFKMNTDAIKTQKVQRYSVKKDSIAGNLIWSYRKIVSHTCHSKLYTYRDKELIINDFSLFDLENNSPEKNIYYKSNNDLPIVKLNKICKKFIDKFEKNKKFVLR